MQTRTWKSRTDGAVRLVAALIALATPPGLLAAVVGNPLPSWPIEWMRVVESVRIGLVPASVWVHALAIAAWTAWAVLVGMLAIEVVAVARHRPSPARVPDWIRHLAQVLVAAAIALAAPSEQALAIGAAAAPVTAAAAPAAYTERGSSLAPQPVTDGRIVTVAEGDSWGGFAAHVLGDHSLGPQLRAANLGRRVGGGYVISESTAFVEPGWQLLIPTRLDSGPRAITGDRPAPDVNLSDDAEPATWHVERGDHFWRFAKTMLTESWGRAPTDAEIVPYWREVIEANRDGLLPPGDPNLIHPGQTFVVLSPTPDPASTGDATPDEAIRFAERDTQEEGAPPPPPSEASPQRRLEDTSTQGPPSGTGVVTAQPAGSADPAETHDDRPPPQQPPPSPGLVGAAFAAGAAAALAAARLRQRRHYQPADPAPGIRDDEPLAGPVVQTVRRASDQTRGDRSKPPHVAEAAQQRPLPGVVVVGVRDEHPITLDLLDTGGLALTGVGADDLARRVIAELLFTAPHTATVLIVGRDLADRLLANPPALPAVAVADLDAALTRLEIELIQRSRLLDAADVAGYRELARVRPEEPTPLLLVVTTVPPEDRLGTVVRLGPRLGIVTLCLDVTSGLPTLSIDHDRRITTADPASSAIDAVHGGHATGLTVHDTTELLTVLAAAADTAPPPTRQNREPPTETAAPVATPTAETGQAAPPVTVQLLGGVRIRVSDEPLDRGLRTKARELLALLLVRPHGVTLEFAIEALWPDADPDRGVQWFRTVLGNLRSTLRRASSLEHETFIDRAGDRYHADPQLFDCDLWRFQQALTAAQAAGDDATTVRDALADAVAAYTGDLADGAYYEWAEAPREDLRRRALDAATRLGELHEHAGANDAALAALERALAIDPYAEELYRRTMRLQATCGRPDAAARTYRYLQTRLAELDADPDPETDQLLADLTKGRRLDAASRR